MLKFSRHIFLTLIFGCLMTACGFHLEGAASIPKFLHTIYLKSVDPYGPLTQQIRMIMSQQHFNLVAAPEDAPITLNISNISQSTTQAGNSTSAQTRIYNLVYTVTFSLDDAKGTTVAGPFQTSTTRSFSLPGGSLPGNTEAGKFAAQQAEQLSIVSIFDRLGSENAQHAVQAYLNTTKAQAPQDKMDANQQPATPTNTQ